MLRRLATSPAVSPTSNSELLSGEDLERWVREMVLMLKSITHEEVCCREELDDCNLRSRSGSVRYLTLKYCLGELV